MRIYVAGPMRQYEFYNFPAFHEAEQHLKDLGYEVVSPARLDIEAGFTMAQLPDNHDWSEMPPGMDYEETMQRDLAALDKCDAIYMLRGWHTSQGARREQIHAAATKRHEFFEQDVLEPPGLVDDDESAALSPGDDGAIRGIDGKVLGTVINNDPSNYAYPAYKDDCRFDEMDPDAPTEAELPKPDRKHVPIESGCYDYFPHALAAVAYCSWVGNEQHNPGEPMRWAKEKSNDHGDCAARHRQSLGTLDSDNVWHDFKVVWRELARLETMLEQHPERRVL